LDGSTLNNRYEIVRSIGHGGAAIVYLGRDLLLNRQVAIKILRGQFASDPSYVERFQREAQAAASFAHPNIIDIYDVGEVNDSPYIVMEYIPGDTLKEIIETEGPFDPDDVAALIEQVAAGLDYAHARGIIHRDVKPQNILVTREGLAKVVDFGIAKGPGESALTDAGLTIGTAHYISPEQASGLSATPASDVYSLGIIAYEMLCGQLPFDGNSAVAVAMMQVNQPPTPPDEIDPEVPPGAADIVLRALEKDPTRRYPSAGAFAEALTNWRTNGIPPKGMMTQPLPAQPARSNRAARTAERASAATTVPIPSAAPASASATAPRLQAPYSAAYEDDGDALAAPIYPHDHRDRGSNGTLWAGFFVVAALALIVWIGGRVADNRGGSDTPPAPTQTVTASQGGAQGGATEDDAGSTAEMTTAPNLVGLTQQAASDSARVSGLSVSVVEQRPDASADTGTVIEQIPEPGGELKIGDAIEVVLSAGSNDVDLADAGVTGLPVEQAAARLTQLGLTPVIVEEASEDVDRGDIIRTEPADQAPPGSEVTLFVSVGDQVWVAPELQGESLDTVISTLENAGLDVTDQIGIPGSQIDEAGIDREANGIVDRDVVGIQDNGAAFGVWLPRGTSVTLVYYDAAQDQ
jgi:serine/threonine-protein kinase